MAVREALEMIETAKTPGRDLDDDYLCARRVRDDGIPGIWRHPWLRDGGKLRARSRLG